MNSLKITYIYCNFKYIWTSTIYVSSDCDYMSLHIFPFIFYIKFAELFLVLFAFLLILKL